MEYRSDKGQVTNYYQHKDVIGSCVIFSLSTGFLALWSIWITGMLKHFIGWSYWLITTLVFISNKGCVWRHQIQSIRPIHTMIKLPGVNWIVFITPFNGTRSLMAWRQTDWFPVCTYIWRGTQVMHSSLDLFDIFSWDILNHAYNITIIFDMKPSHILLLRRHINVLLYIKV